MKKIFAALLIALSAFTVSALDTVSRDVKVLPAAAQTVIKNNFKAGVSFIKIDKTLGMIDGYEVVFRDGSEITFDTKGNWKDVEVRNSKSVPSAFIPVAVTKYVKNNQNGSKIVGIEKDRSGYTVDLANGVELKFDMNGKFTRYDD